MTSTGGATTPAGWYTDPGGSGHLRWWDGSAWTAHLAPQPTPAPAPVVQQPVVQQPVVQQPYVQQPIAQAPSVVAADNQPYVPFQGSWNTNTQGGGYATGAADDFARPAQWNTAGAWLLAFSYLLTLIVALIYILVEFPSLELETAAQRNNDIAFASIAIQVVLWVLQILFVLMDRRKLRSFGYLHTASFWWILLLPPLVYLIIRGVVISREVRHGWAPLVTYLVSAGGVVLLSIGAAVFIPAVLTGNTAFASTEFASSLQTGLDQKGGHFTVTCPAAIPTTINSTFTCTAVDSAGKSHSLSIQVIQGTDGQPTVKLLSVTPAIAG